MGQTHDELTQNLAERWCWQVARHDDTRIARRLYRQPLVDGVYRLDEGARSSFCPRAPITGIAWSRRCSARKPVIVRPSWTRRTCATSFAR